MMSDRRRNNRIADAVSRAYQGLLPDLFDRPLEPERRASCSACAMCPSGDSEPRGAFTYFSPEAKCCTYHPSLPNFALGAALADRRPAVSEGSKRLRARIAERHGVTPWGVLTPPSYDVIYQQAEDAFGRAAALLCPYYEKREGTCTVWPYRNAVCSTYFCKHDHGAEGLAFWRALRWYQRELEDALATWALLELGWSVASMPRSCESKVTAEELDGTPPNARVHGELWGDWAGREVELYQRSFEAVGALTADEVVRIGGVRLDLELRRLGHAYEKMVQRRCPATLRRNPALGLLHDGAGGYLLKGYSATDPSRVSEPVYRALDAFDGRRSTSEAIAELRRRNLPVPSAALVRSLYEHRILVDADKAFTESGEQGRWA